MQDASVKSAEYCWARAEESELMAAKAKDAQNRAILCELANRWRRLADESKGDALKPIGANRKQWGEEGANDPAWRGGQIPGNRQTGHN